MSTFWPTRKQLLVMSKMTVCGQGPTATGLSCGQEYDTASSWACPALKVLVREGFVERSERGKYRLRKSEYADEFEGAQDYEDSR